jgi:hypothetical protein
MDQLSDDFWSKVEAKYVSFENSSVKYPNPYTLKTLSLSLERFIKSDFLEDNDKDLHNQYKRGRGYSYDTLNRLRNNEGSFRRDLIDLLCWYTFHLPFVACAGTKLPFDTDIQGFKALSSHIFNRNSFDERFEKLEATESTPVIEKPYFEDKPSTLSSEPFKSSSWNISFRLITFKFLAIAIFLLFLLVVGWQAKNYLSNLIFDHRAKGVVQNGKSTSSGKGNVGNVKPMLHDTNSSKTYQPTAPPSRVFSSSKKVSAHGEILRLTSNGENSSAKSNAKISDSSKSFIKFRFIKLKAADVDSSSKLLKSINVSPGDTFCVLIYFYIGKSISAKLLHSIKFGFYGFETRSKGFDCPLFADLEAYDGQSMLYTHHDSSNITSFPESLIQFSSTDDILYIGEDMYTTHLVKAKAMQKGVGYEENLGHLNPGISGWLILEMIAK